MKARPVLVCSFLIALGTLQMAGDVLQLPRLRALAAALQVSPSMRVFTAHQGYETHAARFDIESISAAGRVQVLHLAPGNYQGVRGPYNRRNVYGAALAYGPLLRNDARTQPMQESVMRYAFCTPGALRQELGLPPDAREFRIRVSPVRADARRDLPLDWWIDCHG